jgi:hypothetical protein
MTGMEKELMDLGAEVALADLPALRAREEAEMTKDFTPEQLTNFNKQLDEEDRRSGETTFPYPRVKKGLKAKKAEKSKEPEGPRKITHLSPGALRLMGLN